MPEGAWARLRRAAAANQAEAVTAFALAVAIAVGFTWGLPGSDSWAADSISPRSCGLGAIAETYRPGHFHTYPPLHMAILTVTSLPWIALVAIRAGAAHGLDGLAAELIQPLPMTGIEVGARLVTAAMAIGTLVATTRLWTRIAGRRAGAAAGVVTATNAVFVYYAHTGNLDVPYLFWVAWSLVEMDRVIAGEAREGRALLYAAAAALTKDQAVAALLVPLPWALVVAPWFARRARPDRPALVRGAAIALGVFLLASGAVTNPSGAARRVAFLLGPASQSWAAYPKGARGALALARDAIAAAPHFTSVVIAVAAAAGAAIAVARAVATARANGSGRPEAAEGTAAAGAVDAARVLLPLSAAVSFTLFFTLGARRTEDRFLLPQALFVLPYAALCVGLLGSRRPPARALALGVAAIAAAGVAVAAVGVASMDATLLADPRYAAERFLARLPAGAHVEVYGGPIFLPRVPAGLAAARPGVEAASDRQHIPGVEEIVDPEMDPRPRAPAAIVLATELSTASAMAPPSAALPFAHAQYRDARSHALFRALADGSLGYDRVFRATCDLPWPLSCRAEHGSTAGEVWIYAPRAR